MFHYNGGKTKQLFKNQPDLFVITAIFCFIIFAFNLTDQILRNQSIIERIHYTLPFLLLAVLFTTKYKNAIDFFADVAVCLIMTIQSKIGDFSGVPFLYLILFRTKTKNQLYVIVSIVFVAVGINSILNHRSISQTFVILSLNIFMGIKYYYDIYLVVKSLKEKLSKSLITIKTMEEEIVYLKSMIKASITKPMTDDEILETYPFMIHSGNNPYRKIQDLRLFADQNGYKQIGGINNISENSQSREFATMRECFSKKLKRKVDTVQGLIVAGIQLGIIHIEIIHP